METIIDVGVGWDQLGGHVLGALARTLQGERGTCARAGTEGTSRVLTAFGNRSGRAAAN